LQVNDNPMQTKTALTLGRLTLPNESAKTSATNFPANFVECVAPSQMHPLP